MKNKILSVLIIFFTKILLMQFSMAQDQFSFDVSEIQILNDGNKIIGSKRGQISTNDGVIIEADNFIYLKIENILNATGKVTIKDTVNDQNISSDNITYDKNREKIISEGPTKSKINSRFILKSSDVIFLRNQKLLSSDKNSTLIDEDEQTYIELKKFNFFLEDKILKGEKILVNLNFNLPQNDKLFFDSGMFNFNEKSFVAKDIEINLKKDIFDNLKNDPRLKGVSAESKNNVTTIKKGVFTSCNNDTDCPPWVVTASQIKHDKDKKQLIYDNA